MHFHLSVLPGLKEFAVLRTSTWTIRFKFALVHWIWQHATQSPSMLKY